VKRLSGLFVAGVILLAAASLAAQGVWDKKTWKSWSADDCKKISSDSPWAKRWAQSETKMAETAGKSLSASGTLGVGDESKLEIWYIIQVRSSQPIRDAFVRQIQIQYQYDKMDEKGRASIDQQTENILKARYDDVLIIHVYYGSNVPQYERELATFWQNNFPSGTVPQEAFLTLGNGKKISPLRFISPKSGANEFELIFPRVVDGQPAISPNDKSIGVEFSSPAIQRVPSGRVFVEFKPEKMKYNGALSF
jgi:hypothetical protein